MTIKEKQHSVKQLLSNREIEIIQKVRNGEKKYFDEIVSKYENLIFQYALRMCGNQEDAEDILQDTFLNAFRSIKNFRGEAKLSTWLFKIANNSCLMKRRKSKFAPEQEISLSDISHDFGQIAKNHFISQTISPINQLLNQEIKGVLQEVLLELPENYRQVFVLADLQELRGQQISEILEISLSTVKSRLHRARLLIRKRLTESLELEKQ